MSIDVAKDIGTLLTAITGVAAAPYGIYKHSMPDSPDNCITIYASGGVNPQHTFGAQAPQWENPTIQIAVRHTAPDTAIYWCESIKNVLDGKTKTTINTHLYISIFQQGDILPGGRDENNRTIFYLNFRIQVRR